MRVKRRPASPRAAIPLLVAAVLAAAPAARAAPYDSVPSQSFVNRIGINIHAGGYNTAYDDYDLSKSSPQPDPVGLQNIEAALRYLKIVHVRDGLDNQYFLPLYPKLNSDLGVKFDFVITPARIANDPTGDLGFAFKIGNSLANPAIVDTIEGPNESDNPQWAQLYDGVTGLPATLLIQQKTLAAVNAVPALYGRTVQASFAKEWDVQDIVPDPYNHLPNVLLGVIPQIASAANYGNAHIYFGTGRLARHPGTAFPPYHTDDPTLAAYYTRFNVPLGQFAMLTYDASLLAPGMPVIATETGYHTTPNNPDAVDLATQAKYTMTLLFDAYNAGLTRFYLFELADEQPDPAGSNIDFHYGLYNSDWTPKPAAAALHNLMTLMSDPGAPLAGTLNYLLAGAPATLGQRLFRRSDGTFVLALWNDVRVCGPAQVPVSPPPQPVAVTLQLPKSATSIRVFDPLLGLAAQTSVATAASLVVAVPDHPVLIYIAGF